MSPFLVTATPVERESLFDCEAFRLFRLIGHNPFSVGASAQPRVLVCIDGLGQIEYGTIPYEVGKGDVWLLPAEVGVCVFRPCGQVTLLEISIPAQCEIGSSAIAHGVKTSG